MIRVLRIFAIEIEIFSFGTTCNFNDNEKEIYTCLVVIRVEDSSNRNHIYLSSMMANKEIRMTMSRYLAAISN